MRLFQYFVVIFPQYRVHGVQINFKVYVGLCNGFYIPIRNRIRRTLKRTRKSVLWFRHVCVNKSVDFLMFAIFIQKRSPSSWQMTLVWRLGLVSHELHCVVWQGLLPGSGKTLFSFRKRLVPTQLCIHRYRRIILGCLAVRVSNWTLTIIYQ
jgi:hypothetical protein